MRNITNVNNKLIAEFMGGKLSPHSPNLINMPQTIGDAKIHCVKGSELLPNGTYSLCYLHELKYHSSWDWLMSVVEKIESVQAWHVEISTDSCTIHNGLLKEPIFETYMKTKIEATYNAVVEFIQWYNKEKK
jgi:hypothetical protein